MFRTLSRALVAAGLAFVAGAVSVTAWYARAPGFVVDFEREPPPVFSGLYRFERAGRSVFAWTSGHVALSLDGADRRVPWICTMRVRGARPPRVAAADLTVAADGVAIDRRRLPNDAYADVTVTVPARPDADGLQLDVTVSPTFVPGPGDRRQLGAQITAWSCAPAAAVLPPIRAVLAGGLTGAVFAASLALTGLPTAAALAGALVLSCAAGVPLSRGPAPYGAFAATAVACSVWVGLGMLLAAGAARWWARVPLDAGARGAIALTGGLLLLELLGLLHPAKPMVDAIFHAHRLEWVMDGRYFFTQPMPSGVRFPYAIALYVVSMPFGWIVTDHVTLLKVVVLGSRALAGLLLYPVVVRAWNDRATALAAVGLFHLVPLPFVVIGNANMTYAFGQSVAVATICTAALVAFSKAGWRAGAALGSVAALAFLSHVGIFPLLFALLLATAAGFRWLGASALRPAAGLVAASAVIAAVFSVVVYYGHFGEAYRTLARVRAQSPASAVAPAPAAAGSASLDAKTPPRAPSLGERIAATAVLARDSFGWPVAAMAVAGALIWIAGGWRDPLGLVLAATLCAAALFMGGSLMAPVEPGFWRYTAEFISRVFYLAMPAVVVLAARAIARAWLAGRAARAVAVAAVLLALGQALPLWLAWIG